MTSLKIDAHSHVGETFAADFKKGDVKFDSAKGAFVKPSTQQEYLLSSKDRIIRFDGAVNVLNEYNASLKNFCPINALEDGETLDRTRILTKNDIVAKPTWKQLASEAGIVIAQGAVAGAALGVVGGTIYGVVTHRRSLPGPIMPDNAANSSSSGSDISGIGHAIAGRVLLSDRPFNPGQLRKPDFLVVNAPPAPGMSPMQAAKENGAQGAFAGAGAIVGAFVGGPIGAIIGGILGGGAGAAFNEAVR